MKARSKVMASSSTCPTGPGPARSCPCDSRGEKQTRCTTWPNGGTVRSRRLPVMHSRATSTWRAERGGGEAAHELALRQHQEEQARHAHDRAGGADAVEGDRDLGHAAHQADRAGVVVLGLDQDRGEAVLAPEGHEAEDRDRDDADL